MKIQKLIEKALAESHLTQKDINNFKSFRVGDTLENEEGASFKILEMYVKPALKNPEVVIKYKWTHDGKSGEEVKSPASFLNTYFGFKY